MTATDVFKQSLAFYGRIFNKIFWISFVSSLIPLIVMGSSGTGQPVGLELGVLTLASMFFSVYMMVLIHQFSQDKNDSLGDAFSLTLKKVLPVTLTSFVFGLAVLVAIIPGGLVGGILASGIENEQLRNLLIGIIVAIPVSYVLYRCFFAAYFTLVDGLSPFDALKASNNQIKGNKLIFRAFMLLSAVMLPYILLLVAFNLMLALSPVLKSFLEFTLNVLFMPFISVFIYRLFVVSKPVPLDEDDVA